MVGVVDYDRKEVEDFVSNSGGDPTVAANNYLSRAEDGIRDIRRQLNDQGIDATVKEEPVLTTDQKLKAAMMRAKLVKSMQESKPKQPEFEPGEVYGKQYLLPVDPDQRKLAIENFRKTPEFDSLVDKYTGASALSRAALGSVDLPQDRLPTIRLYYPDAEPYGPDNYVFTHPDTGRPTLFNEKGMSVGDFTHYGKEALQMAGSTVMGAMGATAGALAGAPTGPGAAMTSAKGAMLGSGIGMAVGGNAFDLLANYFGLRTDTRNMGQTFVDTGADFATGVAGEKLGQVGSQAVKSALGASPQAMALMAKFQQFKVPFTIGNITGNRGAQVLESTAQYAPGSANVMYNHAIKTVNAVKAATNKVMSKLGKAKTAHGAGAAIQKAARNALSNQKKKSESLYDVAYDMVGQNTIIPIGSVHGLRRQFQRLLEKAPSSNKPIYQKSLQELDRIILDSKIRRPAQSDFSRSTFYNTRGRLPGEIIQEDGIPFGTLRGIRTRLIKETDDHTIPGHASSSNLAVKRVIGAITSDLNHAVRGIGREADRALKKANANHKKFMQESADTLKKLVDTNAEENAFKFMMSSKRDNASALRRLKDHFSDDEWGVVSSSILDRIGTSVPSAQNASGSQFSVGTFMTNWAKISPEAKTILFGGKNSPVRKELDNLVDVMDSIKSVDSLANSSRTAMHAITYGFYSTLMAGATGIGIGSGIGGGAAAATAAGAAVSEYVISNQVAKRLITNPRFVKWLSTPVKTVNGVNAHINKLIALAGEESEISADVLEYIKALNYNMGGISSEPEGEG